MDWLVLGGIFAAMKVAHWWKRLENKPRIRIPEYWTCPGCGYTDTVKRNCPRCGAYMAEEM